VFFGLTHDTTRGALARAVLEGVAFAFADGQDALLAGGARIADGVALVGGGARSALWAQILADTLNRPLERHKGAEVGAALGAARLSRLARGNESVAEVCMAPPLLDRFEPDPARHAALAHRLDRFRQLYTALAPQMRAA
jgi:xylulokinase